VEDFDAPAHAWLVAHAALFGWFHPAWAARGGSLPEPWHWEFGGGSDTR
jgi:D-alanyl-D-alanine carboxypeptidase